MGKKRVEIYPETGDPQVVIVNSDKEAERYEEMPFKNPKVVFVRVTDA